MLKKGSGSEPPQILPTTGNCGDVPDPFFNTLLGACDASLFICVVKLNRLKSLTTDAATCYKIQHADFNNTPARKSGLAPRSRPRFLSHGSLCHPHCSTIRPFRTDIRTEHGFIQVYTVQVGTVKGWRQEFSNFPRGGFSRHRDNKLSSFRNS